MRPFALMKRVAKDKAIVGIPPVVRIRPVVVEPPLAVLVPIHVEDVRVAVSIGDMCAAPSVFTAVRVLYAAVSHSASVMP